MKNFIRSLIVFLIFNLYFWFLAEIGLRGYFWVTKNRPAYVPETYLGHVHAKNAEIKFTLHEGKDVDILHRTNSLGLLNKEIDVYKPENVFRVVVLGDSFTEAFQVPGKKNFCSLLEEKLNASGLFGSRKVEVLNAGISGYSPISEYYLYQRELADLDPDLVIVQLFANDVFEDQKVRAMSMMDENDMPYKIRRYFVEGAVAKKSEEDPVTARLEDVRDFFVRHSQAAEYMYVKMVRTQKRQPYNRKMFEDPRYSDGYQFFMIGGADQLLKDEKFANESWALTTKYLKSLHDLVRFQGNKFLVFYIPMEGQLSLKEYSEHVRKYTAYQYSDYLDRKLIDFSAEEEVPFLDLLPVFEGHKAEKLYFNQDGHLTEAGHELVAETLFQYSKNSLIK